MEKFSKHFYAAIHHEEMVRAHGRAPLRAIGFQYRTILSAGGVGATSAFPSQQVGLPCPTVYPLPGGVGATSAMICGAGQAPKKM